MNYPALSKHNDSQMLFQSIHKSFHVTKKSHIKVKNLSNIPELQCNLTTFPPEQEVFFFTGLIHCDSAFSLPLQDADVDKNLVVRLGGAEA